MNVLIDTLGSNLTQQDVTRPINNFPRNADSLPFNSGYNSYFNKI